MARKPSTMGSASASLIGLGSDLDKLRFSALTQRFICHSYQR